MMASLALPYGAIKMKKYGSFVKYVLLPQILIMFFVCWLYNLIWIVYHPVIDNLILWGIGVIIFPLGIIHGLMMIL